MAIDTFLTPICAQALLEFDLRTRSLRQNVIRSCKQRTPESDLTYTRQNHDDGASEDSDLARIIAVWSNLSEEIRKVIVKIIS